MANKIQIRRGKKNNLPPLSIGEYALCTDTNEIYIGTEGGNIRVDPNAAPVTSVSGKKGAVVLSKSDVGLSNVDNTADSLKNVATATKLAVQRDICINLNAVSPAAFDGSKNIKPGVNGILPVGNGGTGNAIGLAESAKRLETPCLINGKAFNGTGDITITDDTKLPLTGGAIKGNVEIENALVVGGLNKEYNIAKHAIAQGTSLIASGDYSTANGYFSSATAAYSSASGYETKAYARYAHAKGYKAIGGGFHACADGVEVEAKSYLEHVIGCYNVASTTSPCDFNINANAFVIGNGTEDTTRSNAFRVTFEGGVYGKSAYNSTGADYAEYFEWVDGNPLKDERLGRFVTLEGDKIRYATNKDEFILGVIATNPSVIGNNDTGIWADMWLRDKWGRFIYEEIPIKKSGETQSELDTETEPCPTERRLVLNPLYDPNMEFTSREHRPEWATVGMLGQLYVYNDGSCEVNGYCMPNKDGIATKSDRGYRVIEKKDDLVRIIFR